MPARPPGGRDAAGRGPRRLARLRWLPQHEIPGIALVGRDLDARAGDQLVERALGKLAVVRHGGHAEQHVLLGDVGVARSDETLDQRLHLLDMLGGARLDRGWQAAERGHVLVKLPVGCLGQATDRLVQRQAGMFLGGARDDLVVDVGDVADVGDVIGAVEVAQQAEQDVEDDDRARVADMGEVVDRRAAHIHAHARGIERPERPLLARERIVKLELHRTRSGLVSTSRRTPRSAPRGLAGRGVQKSRVRRNDGRSQRGSLANNLPANAADMVKAVHGRGAWASAPSASRARPAPPGHVAHSHVPKVFPAAARSSESVAFMS